MAKYHSTERVERDGYLLYAEGAPIPETDEEELARQGLAKQAAKPANKQAKTPGNKSKG